MQQPLPKHELQIQLNEKKGFQVWWRLLRPHTLTAAFIPVFIGTMLASLDGKVDILLFSAMLLASLLIQAATNMFNEYYDYVRGLDNEQSVGIGGAIVRDGIKPRTVLLLALTFFTISILLGIYICFASTWWVAAIGSISMIIGYLYTGGPIPIAYTPLGELTAGFFMGTVIIGISYFIQTNSITTDVLLITVPVGIFVGAILLANNIRDLKGDKENGRKTIAILVGRKNAILILAVMFILAYALTIAFISMDLLPVWALISLLSIKKAISAVRGFIGKNQPIEMMPAMIATAKTNTIFGFLIGISLLLQFIYPL